MTDQTIAIHRFPFICEALFQLSYIFIAGPAGFEPAYAAILETAVFPIKLPTYVRFICYRISFLSSQGSDR